MNNNFVHVVGNLVDTPEIQVTQTGAARARFRLASTERRRDPESGTWLDGDSIFLDVISWRRLAEHVGNSLQKGDRVIVDGRLRQWTAERDGVRRTVTEVEAETIGPDLQRSIVTVARARRPWAASDDAVAAADETTPADLPDTGDEVAGTEGVGIEGESRVDDEPQWGRPLVEVGG